MYRFSADTIFLQLLKSNWGFGNEGGNELYEVWALFVFSFLLTVSGFVFISFVKLTPHLTKA